MHSKKSIYKESSEKFGAAVLEEKAARGLLKSKRQDVDLVQNEINKVKNAMSLGEIEAEICGMEHSIQHETLPLKEERELAALNKREETEERLKVLKKDADSLRENCMKAEAITKATKKIYYDDGEKLRELQTRFKEADEIRQDAYMQLHSLKKELYEKNKPFWNFVFNRLRLLWSMEQKQRAVEVESSADKALRKDADKKKHQPKAKNTIKAPPEIETVLASLDRNEIPEKAKEPEVTEEEQEQARKAEELRRKEEAEKLLEQRRQEEKVKEKEALERKRRNAERASARAAQKAQKEAEQKEKKREKRARKKERRRLGGGNALSDDVPEGESPVPSEGPVEATPAEVEIREKAAPTRRPAKASHFTKQTKIDPIPAPLRNRAKRKMQLWMWVLAVALLVLALFLAGNARNLF
ncbi:hypothetical protein MLD38_024865 [Melastoma candidum]|uniref:Uncharacterized protein n=1 Tax=Melastoma candidum TaxID=119954 RepID=A0ACB9NU06_9MYRT|nr:hypothetical protein MLD38_024865 [Melastoma candidum]